MIIMKTREYKPPIKPVAFERQNWRRIDIFRDDGTPHLSIALTMHPDTSAKAGKRPNPRWVAIGGQDPIVVLVDLKEKEVYATGTIPLHKATDQNFWVGVPPLDPEYRIMLKFGGLYQAPPHTRKRLIGRMRGYWGSDYPSISQDEKYLCVRALGEIRIYHLPTRELVALIPDDHIRTILLLKKPPKKMRRLIERAFFRAVIDQRKPNLLWVTATYAGRDRSGFATFLLDWEKLDIVSPIVDLVDLAWREGLDEEFPLRLIDRKRMYDPGYRWGFTGHIMDVGPDGTGRALLWMNAERFNVPEDPYKREKLLFAPDPILNSARMFLFLDRNLSLQSHVRWVEWDGQEWELNMRVGRIIFKGDIYIDGDLPIRSAKEYVMRQNYKEDWDDPWGLKDETPPDSLYGLARVVDTKLQNFLPKKQIWRFTAEELGVDPQKYDIPRVKMDGSFAGDAVVASIGLRPYVDVRNRLPFWAAVTTHDWSNQKHKVLAKLEEYSHWSPEEPLKRVAPYIAWTYWI